MSKTEEVVGVCENANRVENVDSGWAWVVLVAGFFTVATCTSMNATFGLLFGQFLLDMDVNPRSMAVVLGSTSAVYSIGMFFSGPLSKILPFRGTCVACALLMTACLATASQATSLWQFVASFSVVYALASGTLFGLSFLLVNQYFDQRRGLAMAIFFGGSSVGRMLLPLLVAGLVPSLGVARSLLVIGAVWAVTIPAAWMHRPRIPAGAGGGGRIATKDRDGGADASSKPSSCRSPSSEEEGILEATKRRPAVGDDANNGRGSSLNLSFSVSDAGDGRPSSFLRNILVSTGAGNNSADEKNVATTKSASGRSREHDVSNEFAAAYPQRALGNRNERRVCRCCQILLSGGRKEMGFDNPTFIACDARPTNSNYVGDEEGFNKDKLDPPDKASETIRDIVERRRGDRGKVEFANHLPEQASPKIETDTEQRKQHSSLCSCWRWQSRRSSSLTPITEQSCDVDSSPPCRGEPAGIGEWNNNGGDHLVPDAGRRQGPAQEAGSDGDLRQLGNPKSASNKIPALLLRRILCLPRDVFRQLDFGLFRSPVAVLVVFSECCSWTAINHVSYMTAVALRDRAFDENAIGTFLVVPPVLDLAARFTVPLMHDRQWVRPKVPYAAGLLLMAASAAGFPFSSNRSWAIGACCGLFGFGQGCTVSYFGLVAVHYCGLDRLASMRAFTGILPAMFILIFGVIIGSTKSATASYDVGFISIAVFTALPVLVWILFEPHFAKLQRSSGNAPDPKPTK